MKRMRNNELFREKKKSLIALQKKRKKEFENVEEVTCKHCGKQIRKVVLNQNNMMCPFCDYYFSMTPEKRINMLVDTDSFKEFDVDLRTKNPLDFPGYEEKIDSLENDLDVNEAIVTGSAKIKGIKVALGVMDSRFLMGSMGTVVGEKIAHLAEHAAKRGYPLIIFSASGGARMQEGLFSLMQMSKTVAAIERFKSQGGLFISCLTNPTTGGVSASFANLGDIILAEPGALICFAGPRVIEQTIGEKLPDGFQKAEFLLEHGMVDRIVTRYEMKDVITKILKVHEAR